MSEPQIHHTLYASPQLEFWELDHEQWRKIALRPYERRPIPAVASGQQLALVTPPASTADE